MKKILTQLRFDFSLDPTKTFSVMTKVLIYKSHGELSISVILTHKSTFQSTNLQFSHAYANQLFFANAKGQLISKQNCRAITSPKKQTQDFCPGSLLLQGQYKRESIFLQKEDRLSFCINLEVVNFLGRNCTFVFWEKLWLNNLVSRLTDLQPESIVVWVPEQLLRLLLLLGPNCSHRTLHEHEKPIVIVESTLTDQSSKHTSVTVLKVKYRELRY